MQLILDMADDWGVSLQTLMGSMSHFELTMRVVNRRMKAGGTYDRQKIAAMQEAARKAEQDAYNEKLRRDHYRRLGIPDPFKCQ